MADSGERCNHECRYCPSVNDIMREDQHPDGFCICKHCRCRMGLSPARERKQVFGE